MQIPDYEISDLDLYWLAGLLEGEGSFSNSRNTVKGKVYLYPKIVVSMVDRDIIQRVCDIFNTSVYEIPAKSIRPGHQIQFRATLTGAKAAGLMKKLLPVMGDRRSSRIMSVLEAYEELEDTALRRSRNCSIAQKARWSRS